MLAQDLKCIFTELLKSEEGEREALSYCRHSQVTASYEI